MYHRYKFVIFSVLLSCALLTSSLRPQQTSGYYKSSEDANSSGRGINENQRISIQKCEEYKKFTYTEYTLKGSPESHKRYICQVSPEGYVSGSAECMENELPHMAHIGYESDSPRRYICGGSLISDNFVLTAAHCKSDRRPPNIVRLNSVSEESLQAVYKKVSEFIVHPDYKKSKFNDIALIQLDTPVVFEAGKLRPACLWTENELKDDTATVAGRGATGFAEPASSTLIKVKVALVDIQKCKAAMGKTNAEGEYHLCSTESREGPCLGESGGPLQVFQPDNPCQHHLIGVVSKGTACGLKNSFTAYVKVSKFIDWIEKIVWNV